MSEEVFSTVFETVFIEKGAAEAKRAVTDLNDSYETMKSTLIDAANMVGVLDNKQVEARKKVNMTRKEFTALRDEILKAKDGHEAYNMALDLGSALSNKAVSTQRAQVLQYVELNKSARNLVLTEKQSRISIDQLEKSYQKLNSSTRTAKNAQKAYDAAIASGDVKLIASATERLTRAHTNQQRKLIELSEMYRTFGTVYQSLTEGSETYRAAMSRMHLSTDDYRKLLAMYNKELGSLSSQLGSVKSDSSQYMTILSRMTQIQMESERTTKAMAPALRREAQELKQKAIEAARLERELSKLHVREQRSNRVATTSSNRGGLYSALSNKEDSYLLANMRRVGMISPQVAQLAYVLSAITSTAALTTVGIVAVIAAISKLSISSTKAAAELQKYDITLRSLATHGWNVADQTEAATQALGKAVSQDMVNYAAGSIYALDKIAEGTEKLVGYGIDMRLVNQEMEMLGNLALGDSQRLENLAIAYGQVFGQGKARAQEMYQFINAGIPIFELLAQKTGKTTDVIMDMTRNGEVSFEMVRELLKDITSETGRYHDLMQDIANMSFEGNWTKFLNEMKLLMANIGNNLLPNVTDLLLRVNETLAEARKDNNRKSLITDWHNTQDYGTDYKKAHILDAYGSNVLQEMQAESERAKKLVPIAKLLGEQQAARNFTFTDEDTRKAQALNSGTEYKPKVYEQTLVDVRIEQLAQDIAKVNASTALATAKDHTVGKLMEGFATWTKDTLGLAQIDIQDALSSTVFKDRDIIGKSLAEITQTVKPNELDEAIQAALFNEIARVAARRAQTVADNILPADLDLAISRTVDSRKGTVLTGAGTADTAGDAKERQFLLDQYIESLNEENAQIREMIPFYREYIKLQQMKEKDMKPDGDKAGLSPDAATKKEAEAKKLYQTNEALKLIDKSYQVLYNRRKGLEAIEDPIKQTMDGLSGLLEATQDMDERNFINALLKLAKEGSSIERVVSTVERVNKALMRKPGDTKNQIKTDLDNAGSLQPYGLESLSTNTAALNYIKELSAYSDSYTESVLGMVENMSMFDTSIADTTRDTYALFDALELASKGAGNFYDLIMRTDIAQAIREMQDVYITMARESFNTTIAGSNTWATNATVQKQRATMIGQMRAVNIADKDVQRLVEANVPINTLQNSDEYKAWKDASAAVDATAKQIALLEFSLSLLNSTLTDTDKMFAMLNEMTPEQQSAFIQQATAAGVWQTRHDSVYNDAVSSMQTPGAYFRQGANDLILRTPGMFANGGAGLDKLQEQKTREANNLQAMYDSGTATQEELEEQTRKVTELAAAYEKLGTTTALVADVMGQLLELGVNGFFDGLDKSLYALGRSLAGTEDAFKDLGEQWKEIGRTIMNQLPAVFLQASMSAFSHGAWEIGLAFLAASLGTSVMNGILGTQEKAVESDDSALKMMENLQKQFQTMIEQFEAGLLYMDRARAAYIAERQIAQVQGFADGGAFRGTGLAHGVYRQPTYFNAYANGDVFNSVMAEAGPEAVLPLRRGSSGQLGVIATGGADMQVNMILEDHVGVKMTVSDVQQTASGYNIVAVVEGAVVSTIAKGKADNVLRSRYNLKAVGRQG